MEVAAMLDLDHENIVRLCGWAFEDKTLYIIGELVPGGTLYSYVQMAKRNDLRSLGLEKIALGIAQGLRYLQARKLIHRDLAARNIFLDDDKTPKIGDFRLCRREGSRYPYGEKPVKWSAPEVLMSRENCSLKSDIWSYGIVLWEVYSLGHVPFFDIPNANLSEALEKAFREGRCPLKFPDYSPKAVHRVGRLCLQKDPASRPSSDDIIKNLMTPETPTPSPPPLQAKSPTRPSLPPRTYLRHQTPPLRDPLSPPPLPPRPPPGYRKHLNAQSIKTVF
ncbi:unnamed protein product [Dibothriocephalus latus]|uniref:Protein kinase domain-containing protein n=1 Tax=Dibothriocephalus latus TaxID=60516 RepID=A0A3P6QBS7_DIBLA|nr:unnamed protein product [Dibothriocephalus latus]